MKSQLANWIACAPTKPLLLSLKLIAFQAGILPLVNMAIIRGISKLFKRRIVQFRRINWLLAVVQWDFERTRWVVACMFGKQNNFWSNCIDVSGTWGLLNKAYVALNGKVLLNSIKRIFPILLHQRWICNLPNWDLWNYRTSSTAYINLVPERQKIKPPKFCFDLFVFAMVQFIMLKTNCRQLCQLETWNNWKEVSGSRKLRLEWVL